MKSRVESSRRRWRRRRKRKIEEVESSRRSLKNWKRRGWPEETRR